MRTRYLIAPAMLSGFLLAWYGGRALIDLDCAGATSQRRALTIETQGVERLRTQSPVPYEIVVSVYNTGPHGAPVTIEELRLLSRHGQVVARSNVERRLEHIGEIFPRYQRARALPQRLASLEPAISSGRLRAGILFDPLRFAVDMSPGEKISAQVEVLYRIDGSADRQGASRSQIGSYEVWIDPHPGRE